MSAKERLRAVQQVLQQRGVLDAKFCFAPGKTTQMPLSDFQNSVADFMEAYLSKRYTVVTHVGDTPINA